jgi:hypothetical protein
MTVVPACAVLCCVDTAHCSYHNSVLILESIAKSDCKGLVNRTDGKVPLNRLETGSSPKVQLLQRSCVIHVRH